MDKMQPEGQKVKGPINGQGDRVQVIQVFFLLKKLLFSRSTFQELTKQATKAICIGIFVKGTKWIKDQKKRV